MSKVTRKNKVEQAEEEAPPEFVEMLLEFQHASKAWQHNLSASVTNPMWEAVSARVKFAQDWLLNWAKEHA